MSEDIHVLSRLIFGAVNEPLFTRSGRDPPGTLTGVSSNRITPTEAWQATADRAADCALFFDFDGVLSPITDDPGASQPVPEVLEALDELSRLVRRVAIVSARPVDFLRDRFGTLSEVDLFGLYGLERSHGKGETVTEPAALPWVPVVEEVAAAAAAALGDRTFIEFKRLSVALHWRKTPEHAAEIEAWAHAEAERRGLKVQLGRKVIELKPPVDRDKGFVISEAVLSVGCAWYFGDDVSDIKAFDALRARTAVEPGFLGVCVAVASSDESGQEVSDAADFTIDSPVAVGAFLADAVKILQANA
jgi:trehalose 6-phosphate phosphatase